MAPEAMRGAVLIVVMNRDDRRVLFETFDANEFDAIYTAKDYEQAHSFLEQDPRIDAVLLEFAGEATEALAFCAVLERDPDLRRVPVIGIASAADLEARWSFQNRPPRVVDWIRSPVLGGEALHRVERIAAQREPTKRSRSAAPVPDYKFAFDASLDELVLWDPSTGLIVDVNQRFEDAAGVPKQHVIGTPVDALNLTHGAAERHAMRAQLQREGRVQFRCQRARADGTRYLTECVARLVPRGGETMCLTTFHEVKSPDREREKDGGSLATAVAIMRTHGGDSIRDVAAKVEHAFRNARIWVVTLPEEAGSPFNVVFAQAPAGASELDPTSMVALDWDPLLRRVEKGAAFVLPSGAQGALPNDPALAVQQIEGLAVMPLIDDRQAPMGALIVAGTEPFSDHPGTRSILEAAAARIALELELERAREQGRAKGLQDSLTQLPNRLLFNDRLETTLKEAHRTGEMFAVLFVDLDRFKNINDSLGHAIGDEVLITTAKRLRSSVRGSDTVARYAGDEFTMILRHIVQRDDVLRIADKVCRVLEAPLVLSDERELHITASIGVSFYPDDASTADKLLQHADVAMYSAKGMGRNTYQTYVAVPEESHQQRLALEAKLRQAERNGELRVFYQPQVSAKSEDIIGMEALIRWEHPELGMISPGFFIPLAEETGLIVSIGEWVLRKSIEDAHRWQQKFNLPLRISVNLSALQLRQPNLLEVVTRAIGDYGMAAELLELEVTESINVKGIPNLLETLEAIRGLGCSIAIDDFGTGQSSLDYIRRFPADRIKVDQVFVRNIGVDPDDEAIVKATINMAHNLNRAVIAEGVEFEEHLAFLRDHGCEELQGYLFSRPLSPAAFESMLAERERLLAEAAATV